MFPPQEYNLNVSLLHVTIARNLAIVLLAAHLTACGFFLAGAHSGFSSDVSVLLCLLRLVLRQRVCTQVRRPPSSLNNYNLPPCRSCTERTAASWQICPHQVGWGKGHASTQAGQGGLSTQHPAHMHGRQPRSGKPCPVLVAAPVLFTGLLCSLPAEPLPPSPEQTSTYTRSTGP